MENWIRIRRERKCQWAIHSLFVRLQNGQEKMFQGGRIWLESAERVRCSIVCERPLCWRASRGIYLLWTRRQKERIVQVNSMEWMRREYLRRSYRSHWVLHVDEVFRRRIQIESLRISSPVDKSGRSSRTVHCPTEWIPVSTEQMNDDDDLPMTSSMFEWTVALCVSTDTIRSAESDPKRNLIVWGWSMDVHRRSSMFDSSKPERPTEETSVERRDEEDLSMLYSRLTTESIVVHRHDRF